MLSVFLKVSPDIPEVQNKDKLTMMVWIGSGNVSDYADLLDMSVGLANLCC